MILNVPRLLGHDQLYQANSRFIGVGRENLKGEGVEKRAETWVSGGLRAEKREEGNSERRMDVEGLAGLDFYAWKQKSRLVRKGNFDKEINVSTAMDCLFFGLTRLGN